MEHVGAGARDAFDVRREQQRWDATPDKKSSICRWDFYEAAWATIDTEAQ
jgi:hypothetical protein